MWSVDIADKYDTLRNWDLACLRFFQIWVFLPARVAVVQPFYFSQMFYLHFIFDRDVIYEPHSLGPRKCQDTRKERRFRLKMKPAEAIHRR